VVCKKLVSGQTTVVQPRIRVNKEHRQVIELNPQESQDGVTYRLEFKAR